MHSLLSRVDQEAKAANSAMRTQYLRNSALVLSLCTVSSLALSTPHAISTGYMAALASNPLETKMVTAAALAVAGDAVAQGR